MINILITKHYPLNQNKKFDQMIVLNNSFFLKNNKILNFKINSNKIYKEKENFENYKYFKNLLEKYDNILNKVLYKKTKNFFFGLKILEKTCIERLLKYSELIDLFFASQNFNSRVIFNFNSQELEEQDNDYFFYNFFFLYLKYHKKYNVKKVNINILKKNSSNKKLFLNYLLLLVIIFLKAKNHIEIYLTKLCNLFSYKNKKIIFLDRTNFFLKNFNYRKKFFISNLKFKDEAIKLTYKKGNKFEKSLLNLILAHNQKNYNKILAIKNFFEDKNKNNCSLVYTFPCTIYDSLKGIFLEISRFYGIKRHCYQHGSDYGYQKNFIFHFLKDYNNCDIFYSYDFNRSLLVKNNSNLSKFFPKLPKVVRLDKENFKKIWSVNVPRFNFFKKKYVLYIGTIFVSLFEQNLFDQKKIFKYEIQLLDKLNKNYNVIYKLNQKYSQKYQEFLEKRYKNMKFTNLALNSMMPFLKLIKIYSVNFSTSHLEFLTFKKKINFIDLNKVFANKIDKKLIKKYLQN